MYATNVPPSISAPPDSDASSSSICYHYYGKACGGEIITEVCAGGTQGRYVVVQIVEVNQRDILTLCEVEIFASKALHVGSWLCAHGDFFAHLTVFSHAL